MHFLVSSIFLLLFCRPTFTRAGSETVFSSTDNTTISLSPACNAACTDFDTINNSCNLPNCGCNTEYLQAQGKCLLCYSATPEDEALVQFLLDAEVAQCQKEGLSVSFSLNLSSSAEASVQRINRQSADLRLNQAVFLAFQVVGGHIGLPAILLFSLYSRQIRRGPTYLNFCITWIISSIIFSLLLYRGRKDNTFFEPLGDVESKACLVQAALLEGTQLMTACSTLSLIIRLWLGLRNVLYVDDPCSSKKTIGEWTNTALLITPYVFFFVFALVSVFTGINQVTAEDPSLRRVIPTYFYCTIVAPKAFIQATYGLTLAFVVLTVGFDVHIMSILYNHWRSFRRTKTKSAVSLSLLLRMVFFSTYRVLVAIANGIVIRRSPSILLAESSIRGAKIVFGGIALEVLPIPVWIDMLQAATPLVGALVLGITSEMITRFVKLFLRKDMGSDVDETDPEAAECIGPSSSKEDM